jgi:TIR domain
VAKIFISYTARDRKWADWIAVTLRDNGHVPFVHEWEIGAGGNIPRWMDERIKAADCLLAVFTDAYAGALYSSTERWAAYWNDPAGREGFLVPVEVEKVSDWPPLTKPLKRLSLVGLSETEAETALLKFLEPPKPPDKRPAFPGGPLISIGATLEGASGLNAAAFTARSAPLPAERPPLPVSVTTPAGELSLHHVIILVHGIRDFALWQAEIRPALEENGFKVEVTNYGRFNLLEFLLRRFLGFNRLIGMFYASR